MEIKTPRLATDGIIRVFDESGNFKGIVLIDRKHEPFGMALPGGFVEIGETVENALKREMKEEINLDIKIVKLLGIYSDPNRDPRFHTVSCVFVCNVYENPVAGDDAKNAKVLFNLIDVSTYLSEMTKTA